MYGIIGIMVILILLWRFHRSYWRSSYYKATKVPYQKLKGDPGKMGEYQIYKTLRGWERWGARFLFNCYLPRSSGETTEIDLMMMDSSGIYVFESKNYSGWIYGDETWRNWIQTFPHGQKGSFKEYFMNPVIQNRLHMRCLKHVIQKEIPEISEIPVHSIVVFSDHCTLKKINLTNRDEAVVNLKKLKKTVRKISRRSAVWLDGQTVEALYETLCPYAHVTRKEKKRHIKDVRKRQRRGWLWRLIWRMRQ